MSPRYEPDYRIPRCTSAASGVHIDPRRSPAELTERTWSVS